MKTMKVKNIYKVIFFLIFSFTIGCSSDDNDVVMEELIPDIKLSSTDVLLEIDDLNNGTEIDIIEGSGTYKAFSTNEDVVEVEIEDSKLKLKGKGIGKTKVIVQDSNNRLTSINVKVIFSVIQLQFEDFEFTCLYANSQTKSVKIIKGNGGYSLFMEDNSIIKASISGDELILHSYGMREGKVEITIKDKLGLETTITVKVNITKNPFTDEMINAIKEKSEIEYVYTNITLKEGNPLKKQEENMYLFGWETDDYYWPQYYKVWINGDLSVGNKPNSKFSLNVEGSMGAYYSTNDEQVELEGCKIIKNDGKKIWCIFYGESYGELHYGYFITTIK